MNRLLLDLKFNFRLLSKTPLFSIISLVVITIGITVALSIYNMLYELMWRPPAFADGNRYVSVRTAYTDPDKQNLVPALSNYAYNVVKEKAESFDLIGTVTFNDGVLQTSEVTLPVTTAAITPELSTAIQKPLIGRPFNSEDAQPNTPSSVLLSNSLWKQYFNEDAGILGKTLNVDGNVVTVIGVVPDQTHYLGISHIYLPLYILPTATPERNYFYQPIGRLRPGVSKQEAERELNAIVAQINREYPDSHPPLDVHVKPFQSFVVNWKPPNNGIEQAAITIQWVAVAIFLLVSVNLGSLLFLRANSRQQEMALRNAMGSSLWGISKQVLLESFILCFIGSVIGLLVSVIISHGLGGIYQQMLSNLGRSPFRFGFTGHMLASAGVLLLLLWLMSSAMSIYYLVRNNLLGSLNEGHKGSTNRKSALMTNAVVGVEVILCFFLLIVCGLLSTSVNSVFNVDMGASFNNRYSGYIDLPQSEYSDPDKRWQFVDTFKNTLEEETTIEAVSTSYTVPGLQGWWIPYALEDRNIKREGLNPVIMQNSVANNYHTLMNIPLLEGRYFDNTDTRDSEAVAIISQPFAELLWPDESAIGKRFQINAEGPSMAGINARAEPQWLTIVGITQHVPHATPLGRAKNWLSFYRPMAQHTPYRIRTIVKTREQQPLQSIEQVLQTALTSLDRNLVIRQVDTLENLSISTDVHLMLLGRCSAAMGLGAIILSFVAIFGVVSRSVALRTTEIGIRRALGSNSRQAINLFVKQGVFYLMLGLGIGGTGAIITSNIMTVLFPDILASLPTVSITVGLAIGLIILFATWLPAKRAVDLEPGDALRYE